MRAHAHLQRLTSFLRRAARLERLTLGPMTNNLPAIGKNGPRQEENVMARNRTQNGWVRRRGGKWTIHYRVRSGVGWVQKSEAAPTAKGRNDAERILRQRIKEI